MYPVCFAYYCSGHGYGHATRVSAFTCHLLDLPIDERPTVYIVSSAPKHVFAECIARGALYRYAEIDPVIVQPLAYCVDRQKSVDVLKVFLSKKDDILEQERLWLLDVKAYCVLSDAAFLGCLAAKAAFIPSILVTNFTFDSVYSFLATHLIDASSQAASDDLLHVNGKLGALVPDIPVPLSELTPLVEQIHAGYLCADLLFLLPGYIPIPSFSVYPALPSSEWVDVHSNQFHPRIIEVLAQQFSTYSPHPGLPFSLPPPFTKPRHSLRSIIPAPLLVRSSTTSPSVYTPKGRSKFLASIGVPITLHDPNRTKILVVSFGGQVFHPPSRPESRSSSRTQTPETVIDTDDKNIPTDHRFLPSHVPNLKHAGNGLGIGNVSFNHSPHIECPTLLNPPISLPSPITSPHVDSADDDTATPRIATPFHIWVPGAPPATKPVSPPISYPLHDRGVVPTFNLPTDSYFNAGFLESEGPRLLPDASWIAIVCGVSKEQWSAHYDEQDSELPEGFFVAPRDVYMPDLTAIGDVLLGKLGYGTVSECIDACTPFVYVSRPLFIEEHGLRLLLDREGVGIELSRQAYEGGEWAAAIEDAWRRGNASKTKKRAEMLLGIGSEKRQKEGEQMARTLVCWIHDWYQGRAAA